MSEAPKTRQVPCPQCRKPAVYGPENKFRPFCSERCRLIDLGDWASESYRVPTQTENDIGLEDQDVVEDKPESVPTDE